MNNTISNVSFKGLWQPVKKMTKEAGTFNKDKVVYTLHEMVYRPFIGESSEEIQKEVNKYYRGRSFSLWDKFDGQNKGDYFQMNNVKVGDVIDKKDIDALIKQGYTEKMTGGILDDEAFWDTYSNATYEPFGISKMTVEDIKELVKRVFNI